MKPLQPLRSIIYEANGTGSFARTAGMVIILFALGWVTYVVVKTGAIPDLTNVVVFIMSTAGGFYGINRGTVKLQPDVKDIPPTNTPPPSASGSA
jgi:hypothetical protein